MPTLDAQQQRFLQQLHEWRDRDPTPSRVLSQGRNLRTYALIGVLFALWLAAAHFLLGHLASGLVAGILAGMLLRDWTAARRFTVGWPLLKSVLDWQHIESLLDDVDQKSRSTVETGNPYQSPGR